MWRDPLEKICCTVSRTRPGGIAARISKAGCRIAEARLDLIPGGMEDPRRIVEEAASTGARVVATLRSSEEGGAYTGGPEEKLRVLLGALEWGAWMIDVEYRFPLLGEALSSAPGRVIVSAHYNFTPQPEPLYAAAGEMLAEGAGIAKIATMVEDPRENWRLIGLNARWPGRVVAIGMGPRGMVSRLLAPLAGAPFTYAALDSPAAPGQPRVWEVLEAWRILGIAQS
ncbi:MAG: type I 3-dehydroquinate dehydratase [Desulfurococcales archaeon]|nr:type I 3-dehydroquinate dehydratase [Desulfurococcales archaeon]